MYVPVGVARTPSKIKTKCLVVIIVNLLYYSYTLVSHLPRLAYVSRVGTYIKVIFKIYIFYGQFLMIFESNI